MSKRSLIIAGTLLAILIIAASGLYIFLNRAIMPADAEAVDTVVSVDIPQGASTERISSILEEAGVINYPLIFRLYARYRGLDGNFVAGSYQLSPSMSMLEIMEKLNTGDVYLDTYWVTVIEGSTVEQIARQLAEKTRVCKDTFLSLAVKPSQDILDSFPFLKEIDANRVDYLLEGYLFPDTYEIETGAVEETIIKIFLRRMENVFNEELKQRSTDLGLSMHKTLTLASIVEKEAGVGYERERIAGVFHNRLERGWVLGSCATVNYVLGVSKEVLSSEDTDVESPYNTYLHGGLPPGPIAAPGETAIRAALYPEENDYLYFNSRGDGSGRSFFSRTGAEHEYHKGIMMQNIRNRN